MLSKRCTKVRDSRQVESQGWREAALGAEVWIQWGGRKPEGSGPGIGNPGPWHPVREVGSVDVVSQLLSWNQAQVPLGLLDHSHGDKACRHTFSSSVGREVSSWWIKGTYVGRWLGCVMLFPQLLWQGVGQTQQFSGLWPKGQEVG